MVSEVDVVVAGPGVAPGLVALALAEREPALRIALITADAEVGGTALDLILPERLPGRFRALLAPLVVTEWPRCLINQADGSVTPGEPVALVDPVQLWLQLIDRLDPAALITGCADFEHTDDVLRWSAGELACGKLIDLGARRTPDRVAEFVGAGELAALDCPVLADLAAAGEHYDHLQYIPLGDGRVVINRFVATPGFDKRRGDFGLDFGLGGIDTLPVLRFWSELGELCSGLLRAG